MSSPWSLNYVPKLSHSLYHISPKSRPIHERKGGGEKRTGKIRGMELKYCKGMAEIASRDTSLFQM